MQEACFAMSSGTDSVFKERLLTAFQDNETLTAACQDIASEIQSGNVKLYAFVEELGSFVTNKDVSLRERGVTSLSRVLKHLPKDFLNEKELHFITMFYCDRLKDHHSIIPSTLHGILAIVQMTHLPHDSPANLFRVLLEHVQCQSQLLAERRNIYLIFTTLLQNRLDDLREMGPDFIYGIISAIDGERDPRNLMLLFDILPQFMREFPLGHLTEEMFEIIACYFPVDFNPSGSDGLRITREDLAEKLAPCLCAIPGFAEFCLPLIADKLSSSLKVAKLDSLNLLCNAARKFGPDGLRDHLVELWPALRKEIMPGSDPETRDLSLKAVTAIIRNISDDAVLRKSFIEKIITDTTSSLCDVQLSLFKPTVMLLETVAKVNKDSCMQVLRAIIPLCLGQYSTKTLLADKVILIGTLNSFIKISADLDFSIKSVPELAWTDIPQIYVNELSVRNTELKSKILVGLSIQKRYLSTSHRTLLYQAIQTEIESGCNQIGLICHSCLLSFAVAYPDEVLSFIKDHFQIDSDQTDSDIRTRRLEALSAISKAPELGAEILPQIVSLAISTDTEISITALTCLLTLVTTKNVDFDIQHYLYKECNIIEKLIPLNISNIDRTTELRSDICRFVVHSLTVEEQQEFVNKYSPLFDQNVSELDVVSLMNIFISLRPHVNFGMTDTFLEKVYDIATRGRYVNARYSACRFISILLNKTNGEQCFQRILDAFNERIINSLKVENCIDTKQAVITLQVWLTKAALARGYKNGEHLLTQLTDMFNNDQIGQHVAQECKILTSKDNDDFMSNNFCKISILYKQRIFQYLLKRNGDFKNQPRQNYLTVVVGLLEDVPLDLLFWHITELVPVLTESLTLDNEQLIFTTLEVLKVLIGTKNSVFFDKAQCFIPRFLNLSTHRTMRVRIAALECLTHYTAYPTILIGVYKVDVLDTLATAIDDKKRLVRKAAVKARTQWFLVGAPGGIKEEG